MIRAFFTFLLLLLTLQLFPQQGQLSISRIDKMPESPVPPLNAWDWKTVAQDYDRFVFNLNNTGQYLPLLRLGTTGQFNYPGNTALFLDSYVGADDHLNQAEAINIIPAIVGATLTGIDKSNQNGMNWVAMTKDFFNLKNGQNVYLNGYSTTSGSDWWYDIMPNVYFYQLRSLYRGVVPEFESQFISVADRWLACVSQLGGGTTPWKLPDMNFRAFNLITGRPLTTGVPEPEAAGSIAWLLYNAYLETGNSKYFTGAQLAMEFLTGLSSNPSYELQLPYGTLAAARMNAVEATDYPIQKMLDWCFNRGDLRGWGAIVGNWGGLDASGLIGEANDSGDDYAFVMNGFQQAAALAPLPKYDKRYARTLAKWILNLTSASRSFYRIAMPGVNQDSWAWSAVYDSAYCIPYESLKQVWQGKSPFATGDAMRGGWAATNLSLYSGSSVGYLAGIVQQTDVPQILQIDLNRTDFYGDDSLPAYLYYNPDTVEHKVMVDFPGTFTAYSVYEAITEKTIFTAATTIWFSIPPREVRLIRLYPPEVTPEARNGRLYAADDILDYHFGYNYSASLRIKALSTDRNPVIINSSFDAFCEAGNANPGDPVQYEWFLNDVPIEGKNLSAVQLTAPAAAGEAVLRCRISLNGKTAQDTIHLNIVDRIAIPPVVNGIQAAHAFTVAGGDNIFTALTEPVVGETLEFSWTASAGNLYQTAGSSVSWHAPATAGVYSITVKVTNPDRLSTAVSAEALVKDTALAIQPPLIWYPFDTDDKNAAADRFHSTATGVTKTDDARGLPSLAYRFTEGQDIIYTANEPELNFTDAVSLSCWVKCEQLGSERFILSHGSWQQRFKLSITPEGKLRWTVKTNTGIADLDGSVPIELNRYYHVTVLYTGYSMELYLDGVLDAFKAFPG
ncbi:MAG: LamG-like jellyroll fold domain-containing protein, partial [Bacteroidales bacterium]